MGKAGASSQGDLYTSFGLTDPTLPKDRLGSKQFATYVDVLGEGEQGGFPSADGYTQGTTNYNTAALKDIYLNGTQILTSSADPTNPQDTDYNFRDVGFTPRFGTANQTFIPGIADIETEKSVGVVVENGSPITRSITNTDVNAVRVTVAFPRLEKYESNGDINGAEVSLSIQIQHNSGGYTTAITDTVKGRSSSTYLRDYRVTLTGAYPVDVRVVRNTADSTDAKLHNLFQWTTYTEIIDEQRAYPNTAHVALRFDAEQFPQIPRRSYKVRGIKTKIPVNATVQSDGSLSFSGSWNGTFKAAKESHCCPAWILYDLLINERYGFGSHITESQIAKYDFYNASVYNNAQINNGLGGTEPRFTFNGAIQRQTNAYRLIQDICASMRVMPYWSNGTLTISQDAPKDSTYLFTLANVTEGGFTYSGSSVKTRATQVNVSYFDNETQEIDWEEVGDTNYQAKFGIIQKNIKAFGCTSRGQASRLGKWMLYTLFNETETITFTSTIETCTIAPGDVIDVADPVRSGLRRGGRINAATTTQVTVDNTDQTDLDATNNPILSVVLPDGSVEAKTVTSIVGAVITVSSAFSAAPNVNSVWTLSNDTVQTSQWRVVSISEVDESGYQITALAYNSSKYAYVEDGATLPTRTVSILNQILSPPGNLQAIEQIVNINNQAKAKIIASWTPVSGATNYRVQWKKDNGNWIQDTAYGSDYEILDTSDGIYDFRVFTLNNALKPSANPSTVSFSAVGKTAVPADIANLTFEAVSSNTGRLRWDQSTELDVKLSGKIEIRHSSDTSGNAIWSKATTLIPAISGSASQAIVPLVEGEIFVKAVDDGGRESTNATSVIVDLPDATTSLGVVTQREDLISPTPFTGAKTNVYYDAGNDCITLEGENSFDAITDVDAVANWDIIGDVDTTGTYLFANQLDLGAVYSLDLKRHLITEGYLPDDLFDSRAALCDTWPDFDGANPSNVDAKIYVRTTDNDPASGSPTWSAWQEFANGTHKARGYEFKSVLSSGDTDENIRVKELGFSATLKRRQEQSVAAVASGAGAKTINFSKPFFVGTSGLGGVNAYLPSVSISVNNLSSGDYIDGPSVTASGFSFTIKNSSGAAINKNFTWHCAGYGLGV